MDILTQKGQLTLPDEARAHQLFTSQHANFTYVETPKDKPSDIDAFLVKNGIIKAVVETKCRYDCDINKFFGQYNGKWLVTLDKIERCRDVAKSLCVDFVGFLYLKQSDILLVQKISNVFGSYVPNIEIKSTETQATINGGKAVRSNAYIDMSKAKVYGLHNSNKN